MGLVINKDLCIGCGLCVDACSSSALRLEDGYAVLDESLCTLCGICRESCPQEALRIERDEVSTCDVTAYHDVWIFAEREDAMLPVALELTGCARTLADARGCRVAALLPGGTDAEADVLIAAGADMVLTGNDVLLTLKLEEPYAEWFSRLAKDRKPEIMLFGATAFGRSLAPRVAAALGTGLTADCNELTIDPESGLLHQTRPAFGGNLMATIITPTHRPQMATVRPGVMPVPAADPSRRGTVEQVGAELRQGLVKLLSETQSSGGSDLQKAEIIVSAGRGIGQRKNLQLVRDLAEKLGGTMGVSRPLVEMGWARQDQQIGQTGCAVGPKLLITCGISGAIQHLAGIANAETIVAINTDPDAPIFSVADYKLVGDAVEILKTLIEIL
ncbi:MAG: electron transfer flavoprotein subunit alpha [Ruminococcaceae bacterium]|nr:electron transfer flavoprotein subunit alpha [Oscillospiraceae bacterium]